MRRAVVAVALAAVARAATWNILDSDIATIDTGACAWACAPCVSHNLPLCPR